MGVRMLFKAAAMLIILGYCSLLAYQGVVSFNIETTRPVTILDAEVTELSKPSDFTNITLDDIFISVKTSKYFINTRLPVILKTWYQLAKNQTWFFTDIDNKKLKMKTNGHMVNTNCSASHQRRSLCCKTSVEFDYYLESGKKWFCHFDDDNYVNIPRLVELLNTFNYTDDWYLGKTSVRRRVVKISKDWSSGKPRNYAKARFWFATGGAGYCISKALALKMKPKASRGKFTELCEEVRYADDVTLGYLIEQQFDFVVRANKNLAQFIFLRVMLNPLLTKWFCHFDDDNYVNIPRLVHVLQKFNYVKDWYLGKTSVRERTVYVEKIKTVGKKRKYYKTKFWFGTGGAGYCISKALALKMKPRAAGGKFISICEATWFPDDVTMGYLIEHLLKGTLTVVPEFHSHIELLSSLEPDTYKDQVSFSYNIEDKNFIKIPGFNAEDERYDPTRMIALHCSLFPKMCPRKKIF